MVLVPSAVTGLLTPRIASPLLNRVGPDARPSRSPPWWPPLALGVASLGAEDVSAYLLVAAVVAVTFAFGLGQPALMEAVGDAVADDVRGVALGIATLFFLVGGGVGSAVVGGLGDVLGMAPALLMLAALPLLGLLALAPQLLTRRAGPRRRRLTGVAWLMSRWVTKPSGAPARPTHDVPSTPQGTMTDDNDRKDRSRLGLSPAQVTGSALAAMSGAFLASWFGTTGTLVGAAVGSVVATVGAAIYTHSLRRTASS